MPRFEKTYTYRSGIKLPLKKASNQMVVRALPDTLREVGIVGAEQITPRVSRVKIPSRDLESVMQRARKVAATHHAYINADDGDEFLISDQILVSFREDVTQEEIDEFVGHYGLIKRYSYNDRDYQFQLTDQTGMNPVKLVVKLTEHEPLVKLVEHTFESTQTGGIELPSDASYAREWHLHATSDAPIEMTSVLPSADAGITPPKPSLRVYLSGDKVKRSTVERGTSCVLHVDWGQPDDETLVGITGAELQRAREAELEVVFVLYRGSFKVEGNKTRIATRFKDDGFVTPVKFNLIAPDTPEAKSKLYLEIEIHGRPAVRVPILLTVAQDLRTAPEDVATEPVKVDLDKLIAGARRPPPTAVLRINSTNMPSAELTILKSLATLDTNYQKALAQQSVTNQLAKIAKKMDGVANDPIWNLLSDPLNPTQQDMPGLSEPLAVAAAAGSELHEWLAKTAGMEEILRRINDMEPGSRIIVRSDGVAIPWETIYPERYRVHQSGGSDATDVDPAKFWGYRFEFETVLSPGQHDLPTGDTDRMEQHRNAIRKLTAVLNLEIDSERVWKAGPPVDYQRGEFTSARGAALAEMHIKSECTETRMLLEDEGTSGSFVYFYCHGSADKPFDPEEAVLKINEQCRIAVSDVSYDATFSDAPIVFLNSCSSGPLAAISFDSFCARFLHKGALGLITTSFSVPAPFAARFGCELILQYMNAKGTLGGIVLNLRKKALDKRIPIGLFYMLRCPADASLMLN